MFLARNRHGMQLMVGWFMAGDVVTAAFGHWLGAGPVGTAEVLFGVLRIGRYVVVVV